VGKYSWEVETIKRFFMALLNASLEDIKKSSKLVQKFSFIVFHCFSGGGGCVRVKSEKKSPVWLELVMNNGNYEIGPGRSFIILRVRVQWTLVSCILAQSKPNGQNQFSHTENSQLLKLIIGAILWRSLVLLVLMVLWHSTDSHQSPPEKLRGKFSALHSLIHTYILRMYKGQLLSACFILRARNACQRCQRKSLGENWKLECFLGAKVRI